MKRKKSASYYKMIDVLTTHPDTVPRGLLRAITEHYGYNEHYLLTVSSCNFVGFVSYSTVRKNLFILISVPKCKYCLYSIILGVLFIILYEHKCKYGLGNYIR